MLKRMQFPIAEVITAIWFFHADIIGNHITIHAGDIHSFFQLVMIDGKACNSFHFNILLVL